MKTFSQALSSRPFVVTAEIPLWGNTPAAEIVSQAQQLAPYVDGLQFTPHPQHRGHMPPVALAALLIPEGIDPIIRLNCRDRNRSALRSELIGLRAVGASSLILSRGAKVENQKAGHGEPVFDTNCQELIAMAAEVGKEQSDDPGGGFLVGTNAKVFRPDAKWKGKLYKTRADAGVRFLQTQPCLSVPMLTHFMKRLVSLRMTWSVTTIATLAPLPGMNAASWQYEQALGTVIPKPLIREIAESADPEQAGIEACARQINDLSNIPGVGGVNLLTVGNPEAVIAAITASGIREAA